MAYIAICVMIFVIGVLVGYPDRGVISALSFAAIALAAKIRWDLCRKIWMWILIIFWSTVHVFAVISIGFSINIHPTILLAPIFIFDFLLVLGSIFLLELILER